VKYNGCLKRKPCVVDLQAELAACLSDNTDFSCFRANLDENLACLAGIFSSVNEENLNFKKSAESLYSHFLNGK
jgi:hypothetical protein